MARHHYTSNPVGTLIGREQGPLQSYVPHGRDGWKRVLTYRCARCGNEVQRRHSGDNSGVCRDCRELLVAMDELGLWLDGCEDDDGDQRGDSAQAS